MSREPRAVLFDLDDTLYPYRRFVLSGFAAIARHLAACHGVEAARVFRVLVKAMRRGRRRRELQACLDELSLPHVAVDDLVTRLRTHRPSLRLPRPARDALDGLRPTWRLAVVTNGDPAVQARKIEALGLQSMVDDVIYATEHGTRLGKPDVTPFEVALSRLRVARTRAVFVGDDEACDIVGAAQAGLRTMLVRRRAGPGIEPSSADAVVRSVADVPRFAGRLVAASEIGTSGRVWGRGAATEAGPGRAGTDGT